MSDNKEKKLMELLRRAHTCIGEALIDNAIENDGEARKLHNEIGALFGLKPAKCACGAVMVDGICSDAACRFNVRE